MSKRAILQSGFISQNDKYLELPIDYDRNFIDNVLMRNYRHETEVFFYSKHISELYTQYRSDNTLSKNFHFRERVYKEAFRLFKTPSFIGWVDFQINQNAITPIHKLFLIDTIKFILNEDADSYSRQVQPEQYIKLVEYQLTKKDTEINTSSYFKRKDIDNIDLLPTTMTEVIKMWLSKPKGFGDLLVSLYVIFGDRPAILDINNKIIRL